MLKPYRQRRSANKRVLVWTALSVLLLAVGAVIGFLVYKPSPLQVALTGESRDLGATYGAKLQIPIHLGIRFYLDRVVCQGNPTLIQSRRAAAVQSLENWPAPYREELLAAASAARVPPAALAFGNAFLDLGLARAGCRSIVLSHTNTLLHAHNLDWDNLGGLGRWITCIVRRNPADGRYATVSVGFPGMIGALDIINEKGLALSFNQLGWGKGATNEPVFIMIRRIAETCDSLDAARTNLLAAPKGMPFIITVSDARANTGSVFERVGDHVTERPLQRGFVAACNVAQGTNSGATRLDQVLTSTGPAARPNLPPVLAHPAVLLECNLYSVIFDFHHNRLRLACGEVPAARGNYREYPLFD